jgi:hypothetical protein
MGDLLFDSRGDDFVAEVNAARASVDGFGVGDDLAGLGSAHRARLNRVWPNVAPHRTSTLSGLPRRQTFVSDSQRPKRTGS